MTTPEPVDPLDESADELPRMDQIKCWAEPQQVGGVQLRCVLPILHAGDHVCDGYRWPRWAPKSGGCGS